MAYFLKHLTEETMALKKLLIPPEFIGNCGRLNLTNPVILEPTVGNPPEVELELYEDGRGFWLRNGWQEFADRYSLSHGHYLLFEYKSFSRFKLVMFGANGVDVMCPAPRFHNVASNRNNQDFVEAEQEEEIRGSPVAGGGGRQPARPRSAENAKQKAFMSSRKGRTADGGQRGKRSQFARDKAETSHIPAMAEHAEGMPGPGRGNTSTSSVSPSFFITINQTSMKHGYANLPTDFVFKHMKLEKSTVIVCSEDGSGPWLLSFTFKPRSSKGHGGRGEGRFIGGWPAFRNDNSLKPRDVCRFKLISPDEMEVKIERN